MLGGQNLMVLTSSEAGIGKSTPVEDPCRLSIPLHLIAHPTIVSIICDYV